MELTRNELRVMSMLWRAKRPLGKNDFTELNTDVNWDGNSLYVALNSLLSKGAIKEDGYYKSSKNFGRYFSAVYTLEEYLNTLLTPVDDIIDYKKLFSNLLDKLDNKELASLSLQR